MELAGYWMERGTDPEKILALSHEDRLIYTALMQLNREQRYKELEELVYAAIVRFWNEINRKR
ncbi:MAG: hypothetical protein HFI11_07770 [Lachnospiraceae bacterium]|nr:hypothetical protein [Lachnospiraceae bacterium]